jgi:hypothetical protein
VTGWPASIVLDSEGLSRVLHSDRAMGAVLASAQARGVTVHVSELTIVEAFDRRVTLARLDYVLPGCFIEEVRHGDGKEAVRLLRRAGLGAGQSHAIDAAVAVMALRLPRPVTVYTSDPADWTRLTGGLLRVST